MAKHKDTVRTGWSKATADTQRREVARASGGSNRQPRVSGNANIQRMGPYETSYQIDHGYTQDRDIV
jgi:hypothetical protein